MAKQSLSQKLAYDQGYREFVRFIGYIGQTVPFPKDYEDRFTEKYGRANMQALVSELTDVNPETKRATLKLPVRKLCFALLGPAPEDYHWASPEKLTTPLASVAIARGTENMMETQSPPRRRAKRARRKANVPGSEHTDRIACLHNSVTVSDVQTAEPHRYAVPPEMTMEKMVRRLSHRELIGLLNDARRGVAFHGKARKCRTYKNNQAIAEAEFRRRGLQIPSDEDPEVAQFRQATSQRLKELLDMCQYELATTDRETITFEEAARDIGFIEAELRRRREENR
ncbi:MAG: hypothetical protein ACJ8C4_16425 [Gemmataceae bacterium]